MPTCHVCGSRVSIYASFCQKCGAKQREAKEGSGPDGEELFTPVKTKISTTSAERKSTAEYDFDLRNIFNDLVSVKEARVGLLLIVISIILLLFLSHLPVAKVTSSEEGYMAYYDLFLERTPGSDTEAPREMIDDEALEDVFQSRIALIQTTIGLLLVLGLLVTAIGHLRWGDDSETILAIRNLALYRLIQIVCIIILSATLSFAGLAFELFPQKIVLLPIVALYMILAVVLILRKSKTLMDDVPELEDKSLRKSDKRINDTFDFATLALITISTFPWLVGLVDGALSHLVTEPSLAASELSDFQIYEMKLMFEDIQTIQYILWLILGACFLGLVSLRICDSSGQREFISSAMLLLSNGLLLLNIFLLYSVYSFVMNVGAYESYFNEIVASEAEQAKFYYFCNYFPAISGVLMTYHSFRYSLLTFNRAVSGVIPGK